MSIRCTEYRTIARTCTGCGARTSAPMSVAVPAGVAGGTCYGPHLRAVAAYAGAEEVLSVQRATALVAALTGAVISTGFVSLCLHRVDEVLVGAGFEAAIKAALRSAGVVGTDESPVRLGGQGRQEASNPHVFTVRTLNAYTHCGAGPAPPDLIWCGAGGDRTSATIDSFAILPGYGGVLVGDDYGGYLKYDVDLAGVQQCVAHLRRYLTDAFYLGADQQAWTMQADRALVEAMHLVNDARREGMTAPDTVLTARLAQLRTDYDRATALGRSVNINATWPKGKGNHPTLPLTGLAWVGVVVAFGVAWLGRGSVVVLVVAIVVLDVAIQTNAILAQARLFAVAPQARSRLNTAYVTSNFIGGAMGSALASVLWVDGGWVAVTVAGAVLAVFGLSVWALGRRGPLMAASG